MKKNPLRFSRHNKAFSFSLLAVGIILLGYIIFNSIEISRNMHALNSARLEFQAYTRVKTRLRDGSDNLTYIAPSMVNLNLTMERHPDIRFSKTREH